MRDIKFRQFCSKDETHEYGMRYFDIYDGAIKDGYWSNPMQYTGINDKNGKEIYEGDIFDHIATYGVIIFEDGMFTFDMSEKMNFGYRQPLCYIDTNFGVVVGNIYENPELLNW